MRLWPDQDKGLALSSLSSDNEHGLPSDRLDDYPIVPSHTTESRLLRKIDLRLIPCLTILYLFAFLCQTNIGNATVFGLREDLGIAPDSVEYNAALTIFFVPYVLFEIPSNIIMKRLKPHVWLSICMFGFGFVTLCQGLVQNDRGLLATRFFLGVFESGMFPGCFYLISMWYKREEAQQRFTFFFSSATMAGAFGGLLATGLGEMDGLHGYRGWRWIFIMEGLLTCIFAVIFWFLLPDFPEDVKWLKEDERAFVKARLETDQGKTAPERPMTVKDVVNIFKDYKILIGGLMYFGLVVPAYGYAYFAPIIIRSYGYSPIETQLYSTPPWAAAFAFAMLIAWGSDKLRHRFLFTVLPTAVAAAGFAILFVAPESLALRYGALFLVASGCNSAMPVVICWFTMNLGGHHRRSVGSACQIAFGNIGGIIATFTFLQKDAPGYKPGYSICIAFTCLSVAACLAYFVALWSENRYRAKQLESGVHFDDRAELGDEAITYRYQL